MSEGMGSDLGEGARLEELDVSGNPVKAASVARPPLFEDAKRWLCALHGIVDGIRE